MRHLGDVLAAGAVVVRPAWKNLDDAIDGLLEALVSAGSLPGHLSVPAAQRIREREAIASTAMVDIGVSIPHARLDGISRIIAAMAVSPRAVYQVGDGLPIPLVALVLSPPTAGDHLTFLSSLSLLLQSGRIRDRLRQAATATEVLHIIRDQETGR
jgi:mannitol/fructose-specific phosphotransferase system IIA component (Ntr-type)